MDGSEQNHGSKPWINPRLVGRIPELDGLRGLAILLVLLGHYVGVTFYGAPGSWLSYGLATCRLSWSGVDLFFVLSGFLIGGILLDARESQHYYRTFYFRRIYRILPLYFTWVLIFGVGLFWVRGSSSPVFSGLFNRALPAWGYLFFLQNVFMASFQTWGARWMATTWSLAVEEQFYAAFPWIVRKLSNRGIAQMALVAIVSAPLIRWMFSHFGNAYFGPFVLLPCRWDALGFGVLIAVVCRNQQAWTWLQAKRTSLYAALFGLGGGLIYLLKYQRSLYSFGISWIDTFYAVMLLLALNPGIHDGKLLRSWFLRAFGTGSYAIYIMHSGIYALMSIVVARDRLSLSNEEILGVASLSLGVVLLLAWASWIFLEKPLIRHAHVRYRF